jgi:hypothetical protein
MMYAKLFTSIYQGTLRGNSHGLLVFTNLLAHCDKTGVVDMHPRAIAEEVGLTVEQVRSALDELESPDDESRSPEQEGRRLVRLDEHRAWGWTVVNYTKYRAIRDEDDRREQNRLSQERWRNRNKPPSAAVSQGKPQSAHTEAEAYTEEKTIAAKAAHPVKPGDARFNAFWKAYPRKVGKDAARKAFDKRKPDDVLTEAFIRAIESQSRGEAWRKDGGQYIPHPATWLNEGRWMDEGIISPTAPAVELWQPPAQMTDAEKEAADKARRAALGAIRRVSA